MKKTYQVSGMSCAACSSRVEKAVYKVEGVESCSVNLLTNSMKVEGNVSEEAIKTAVEHAGYGLSSSDDSEIKENTAGKASQSSNNDSETKTILKRFWISLVLLIPLMYFSMGVKMWSLPAPSFLVQNPAALILTELLLSGMILVINRKFFINGGKGLIHLAPNMDTLVSLGSAASFLYSLILFYALLDAQNAGNYAHAEHLMHQMYFESAAMILVLITLGKLLESISKGKTTGALRSLLALAPQTATVLKDGNEVTVPADTLRVGDIFVVRSGEKIPADGIILSGSAAIDESALTGESIPVDKKEGDPVSAATIDRAGYMRCEAQRVGQDTSLSKIITMVTDASASKAPIARIADKVSGIFVPIVLGLALLTLIVWLIVGKLDSSLLQGSDLWSFSLARAISILVISCPCALGLATPVAIMVGNGVAAKKGILFKTSTALEQTGKATTVVLDKTGTVTTGKPVVTDLCPVSGVSREELLQMTASLEKKSEHPLAAAVMEAAEQSALDVPDNREHKTFPGNGLCAIIDDKKIVSGKASFIQAYGVIPKELEDKATALSKQGKTPIYTACDGKVSGLIAIADPIRTDSKEAIKRLKNMGIKVVLLTGDDRRCADAIGAEAGVDEVISEVLPGEKAEKVKGFAKEGMTLMVGDGINDAPALTSADIGLAIGAGTDVAIDAADVVLMKSSLTDVVNAISLSRKTLRNIKQNLFWAFIYNLLGIPLAQGVWYPIFGWLLNPMIGAACMSFSSVCVVLNALRLNLLSRKEHKTMKKTIHIEGMSCPHCEMSVKKALEALDGVESASVSHVQKKAEVVLSKDVDNETMKAAIEAKDFEVVSID